MALEFEEILPYVEGEGDTGKTAREKIKRNFDKLKPLGEIPAEVQQVKREVIDIVDEAITANIGNYIDGKIINGDGTISDNDAYCLSEYIPVEYGQKIRFWLGNTTARLNVYNSNKQGLMSDCYKNQSTEPPQSASNPRTVTLNTNTFTTAAYFRMSFPKSKASEAYAQVLNALDEVISEWRPEGKVLKSSTQELTKEQIDTVLNNLNMRTGVENGNVIAFTGNGDTTAWSVPDRVTLIPKHTYRFWLQDTDWSLNGITVAGSGYDKLNFFIYNNPDGILRNEDGLYRINVLNPSVKMADVVKPYYDYTVPESININDEDIEVKEWWLQIYGRAAVGTEVKVRVEDITSMLQATSADFSGLFTIHGYINPTGEITSSEQYYATDFILINNTSDISIIDGYAGPSSALIAFYDEAKNIISRITNTDDVYIAANEIPQNATYVRVGTYYNRLNRIKVKVMSPVSNSIEIGKINESIANQQIELDELTTRFNDLPANDYNIPFKRDGYYSTTGSFRATGNARATDLVKIEGYDKLDYAARLSSGACVVAFFDENQTILPNISIEGNNTFMSGTIDLSDTIYENARYVAISYYDSTQVFSGYIGKLYKSDSLVKRVENNESSIDNIFNNIERINGKIATIPLPNKEIQFTDSGYYNLSNGAIYQSSNARRTDKIPIEGYDTLTYGTSISSGGAAIAFFDSNDTYLPNISIAGKNTYYEETLDLTDSIYQDAKYFAMSLYNSQQIFDNYVCKLYNRNSEAPKIETIENNIKGIQNFLPFKDEGLDILIFGDSITTCARITINANNETTAYSMNKYSNHYVNEQGQTIQYAMWPYLLTEMLKCHDVRNYGYSGASYKDGVREEGKERQNLSYQIEVAINDIPNTYNAFPTSGNYSPDIVIFALGTNDGTPNDTYEDAMAKTVMDGANYDVDATLSNLDMSKFCESVRFAFLKVRKYFPNALYFCVLPIQRASQEQGEKNAQLEKLAKRYNMIVIDGASTLGIVRDFEKNGDLGRFLKDGLHPNDVGQKLMAKMIANAIKNNWINIT